MKFHEVAVGERFLFNNKEYTKVEEVRLSCCKVRENAQAATGEKVVLKPMDEVQKLN